MLNIKAKVCGINNTENLKSLLTLPVDMVGFIFYDKSKRNCTLEPKEVRDAFNKANPNCKKVGVFVNATVEEVLEKHQSYDLDYIQLHGNESIFYCQELKEHELKLIKAFSIDDDFNFSNTSAYSFFCDYFLFDTKGKLPGGNGVKFNWDVLKTYKGKTPYLLSGGIGPDDAALVREFVGAQFSFVDVNSKFEIEAGYKNLDVVAEFLYKIKRPDKFNDNSKLKKIANGF